MIAGAGTREEAARAPEAQKKQRFRGRLWRYGPVILWMALIFIASTGELAASNTSRIVRPLLLWLFPGITEEGLIRGHFAVRKGAHFAEYAVLALLAARAFLTSSRHLLHVNWFAFALGLTALYALLDEYHQTFVATRTGSIYDSLIDITGGATALAALLLWRVRRHSKDRA